MLNRSITWGQLKAIRKESEKTGLDTPDDLIKRYNLEKFAADQPDNAKFYPQGN